MVEPGDPTPAFKCKICDKLARGADRPQSLRRGGPVPSRRASDPRLRSA
jgi:hypothetical protein